jgi:Na+-transporting NADH:ubiquinone oxidoreductase subunit NqrE
MLQRHALATVALASLLGISAQVLFFRQPLGLNALLVTVLFLGAAWTRRDAAAPFRLRDACWPASAVAFAAFCAIRTDASLVAFDALAKIAALAATVAAWSGVPVSALPVAGLIAEGWSLAARALVGAADLLVPAWLRVRLAPRRFARVSGYVGGVGLAAPFVVVFAFLFSSADAVFARSLENVFDLKRIGELLSETPGRLFIALAVAWPAAGAMTALWRVPRDYLTSRPRSMLAGETATVTIALIAGLFATFVALQLAYLFGGRDTLDAAAITYSAYARRGFFELIAAVALVGALLFGLELFVSRRGRSYHAAAFALLALTAVVLTSAAFRLDLYQRAYGWSELRFYAFAAIAFLAGALAIFTWSVARGRMAFVVVPLAIAAVTVALAANVIGPSGVIARANLDRVIDPSGLPDDAQRSLDIGTLWSLGDGAIPEIVARLDSLPTKERMAVGDLLRGTLRWRNVDGEVDWRGWNADRERARRALVTWRDGLRGGRPGPR